MKQSKKVVARIIILILALFTVIPGTVSQKVYAEPGGSESSQAADASKDDSNKKEEKKEEDMTPEEREVIFRFYLKNMRRCNNWDLVDLTCRDIVGEYWVDKDRSLLYRLAESENLWEQRISIVSTWAFIRRNDFGDTLELSERLIGHKHDLMHKAVGWMLREVGKKERQTLTDFLERNATRLPRTALRYAIEHYPEPERQYFLKKK